MNETEGTIQLPPQWSTIAPEVDDMYYAIFWISVVFAVGIYASTAYFSWKYRKRKGHKAKPTGHSTLIEILWTFTPLILLGWMFHEGFVGYVEGSVAPDNAVDVRVRGMQWNWEFEHEGGVIDDLGVLKVPVNRPVRLIMSSQDVLHSFFVPHFRVKRDVVPGMYSTLWFEATRMTGSEATSGGACENDSQCAEGTGCNWGVCTPTCTTDTDCQDTLTQGAYCGGRPPEPGAEPVRRYCTLPVFCTEYCGAGQGITRSAFNDPDGPGRNTNHSTMMAEVHVIPEANYQEFLAEGPPCPSQCTDEAGECDPTCWGRNLYSQNGCNACHSVDGSSGPAPTWQGLWGNAREFSNGAEAVAAADENYIRESILNPGARIVSGYENVAMPAYRLSDRQIEAITRYMQSLSE